MRPHIRNSLPLHDHNYLQWRMNNYRRRQTTATSNSSQCGLAKLGQPQHLHSDAPALSPRCDFPTKTPLTSSHALDQEYTLVSIAPFEAAAFNMAPVRTFTPSVTLRIPSSPFHHHHVLHIFTIRLHHVYFLFHYFSLERCQDDRREGCRDQGVLVRALPMIPGRMKVSRKNHMPRSLRRARECCAQGFCCLAYL